jgi:nickel transport protein
MRLSFTANGRASKILFLEVTALMIATVFFAEVAFAHKIHIYAWVKEDTVYTQSYSGGKKPVKNGKILVLDNDENTILTGMTDSKGEFSFKIPKESELKVVLDDGMGHRAHWTIPLAEVKNGEVKNVEHEHEVKETDTMPESTRQNKVQKLEAVVMENHLQSPCLSSEELKEVVERVVDKKMQEVVAKLDKAVKDDNGPAVTDILGGIGYIFGLVGIGAYFNYRRKRSET